MSQKELQQLELSGGQLNFLFAAFRTLLVNPPRCPIQAKRTCRVGRLRRRIGLLPPQMRLDTSYQFTRAERLRNVIVAADFETQNTIDFFRSSRQKNHWTAPQFARLPHLPADIEAVLARQ